MPKKTLKRLMPDPGTIKNHKYLSLLGSRLHDNNLWHLNRHSAAGAFAVGLCCAWLPIPFQMVLAAVLAMTFRVNLPLSAVLVWISNPLTMPPMFYFAYRLGSFLLDRPQQYKHFELSLSWLSSAMTTAGPSLLLGCGVMALVSSATGFMVIHGLWRWTVSRRWKLRRRHR
ncbi:DUF2062 domain-containing protein [Oceanisphaera arctica]|uniref:Flagellar biosynthesis protein FlhF n=1 Tax=Oceanisphaera arctica TaxID=641510 RepID=A0A2P5TMZ1_9GAMM|nr:DUF2062 domain-containing protein [Oceanisphaera arctica]PPL16888.1 flagellar biosynthesis protein FlhF [Oceanisphaera arctica]GHA19458.1 ATP-binding protein [Oceanisphaera arctica]